MTNTKFRKRALLSSVAMLLVAMLALGSATFAWYQANLTVSAENMTFSTNAASGLEMISASAVKTAYPSAASDISSQTSELEQVTYGSTTTFKNRDTALQPVSFNPTTTDEDPSTPKTIGSYWTASGTDASDGTLKAGAITSGDANVLSEYVYFKIANEGTTTNGTVALSGVTITPFTSADCVNSADPTAQEAAAIAMSSAIRVVVYKFDGSVAGEYAAASGLSAYPYLKGNGPYVEGTGVTYDAKTYNSTYVGTKAVTQASAATPVELGAVTKTALNTQGCKICVYLDGFDGAVISNNAVKVAAGKMILKKIKLDFTMTPAA